MPLVVMVFIAFHRPHNENHDASDTGASFLRAG